MNKIIATGLAVTLLGSLLVAQTARSQTPSTVRNGPGSFLQVDRAKLYYEECGNAPQTVVVIHDGVVDSAVWDEVWPEFCKHFHTIRYDRRGYRRKPIEELMAKGDKK